MTALALAITVLLLPLGIARSDVGGTIASLLVIPWLAGVLLLQARGQGWWAALALSMMAVVSIVLQMLSDGIQLGGQYYLVPSALLPFLVFSPRHTVTAVIVSLISSGALIFDLIFFHDQRTFIALFATPGLAVPLIHAAIAALICALGLFARRILLAAEAAAEYERDRVEALLVKVFPRAIARRLKEDGKVPAERIGDASVLFCRVIGLEQSAPGDPRGQLSLLRALFAAFDDLCDEHRVEKIKSFGASYMVASGAPIPHPDHAERLAGLALGLRAACAAQREASGAAVAVRIGIHSGPVVGGILGTRNLTFDLWGDTVNMAQRMEAHGLRDEIQLSAVSFSKINHRFRCEPREPIEVKGKLAVRTYLLRGLQSAEGAAP